MSMTRDTWALACATFTLIVTLVGATWKVSSAMGEVRSELGGRVGAVEARVSAVEANSEVLVNQQ